MSWRKSAILDIKVAEGCRYEAYLDTVGVWTIGYGHTGPDVTEGLTCLPGAAEAWLDSDVEEAEMDLDIHAPWWREAPDQVRRGLLNMCFNLGWAHLSKFKKMLRAGANSDWEQMATEALNSVWDDQVGARATHIASLFRSGAQASPEKGATV